MAQRRAGIITIKVNGEVYDAKGSFTYNPGRPKAEAIVGADTIHGYKETPQVAFVEGAITDRGNLDLVSVVTAREVTVSVDLANGKTFVLRDAWYAGSGNVTTEEAEIEVRWESGNGEEIG